MFDFSWGELLVIGAVALVVIGPKELPAVLRTFGQYMGKVRRMAADFQGQFQEAMREAEMADLKKEVDAIKDSASGLASDFTQAASIEDPTRPATTSDPIPAGPPPPLAESLAESSADGALPLPTPAEQPALPPPEAAAPPPAVDLNIPVPEAPAPVTEKDFATAPAAPAAPPPKAGEAGA